MPARSSASRRSCDASGRRHARWCRRTRGGRRPRRSGDRRAARPAAARHRLRTGSRTRSTRSPRPRCSAPCASSTTSRAPISDSATDRRTFFWLCVSLALTTSSSSSALCRDRPLGAFGVGNERRIGDAVDPFDPRHHLVGTRHRRDRLGRDERRGLDAPQSGARQRVDQADAVVDRNRRLVLQPVARPDLADLDACGPSVIRDQVTGA